MAADTASSRPAPPALAAGAACYTALVGALQVLWLHSHGAELREAAAFICAAPTLLVALFAWGWRADAPHYRTRLLACATLSPPLLLLWAQSQTLQLAPVVTALHALLCLACHAAVLTAAMERLRPKLSLSRLQFSWVTSLVLR